MSFVTYKKFLAVNRLSVNAILSLILLFLSYDLNNLPDLFYPITHTFEKSIVAGDI